MLPRAPLLILITSTVIATLVPTPSRAGFATILAGDAGQIDGTINRSLRDERFDLLLDEELIYVPAPPATTPGNYALAERFEFIEWIEEQATIQSNDDRFALDVKTQVNAEEVYNYYRFGEIYYDTVPTLEQLGLETAETQEFTLQDGTTLVFPRGGRRLVGSEGASFTPTYLIQFDTDVDFRLTPNGRFRDEGSTRTFSLSAVDSATEQRDIIVSDYLGYFNDWYYDYERIIDGQSFAWTRYLSDWNSEAHLESVAAVAAAVEASEILRPTEGGYAGRLPAGLYELKLSSTPGSDIVYFQTDLEVLFEATPVPEPAAIAIVAVAWLALASRRRPCRRL